MKVYIYCTMLVLLMVGCTAKTNKQGDESLSGVDLLKEEMSLFTGNKIQLLSEMRIYEYEADTTKFEGFASVLTKGLDYQKRYDFVKKAKDNFKGEGYLLFYFEDNKNGSFLGAIKSNNPLDVIRWRCTDGINYDLTNEDIIKRLETWNADNPVTIIGAGFDWLELKFNNPIPDVYSFAREVYDFCPDIVDQGVGDVILLANDMKERNGVFLWWD